MSESTQNISELSHSQESLSPTSRIEDIIGVAPEYSDKIQRYERQISSLSPEEQTILIEKWKQEVTSGTANMGVFGRLIREFRTRERQEEKVQVETKEVKVETKEVKVETKEVKVETKEVKVETKEVQAEEEKVQVEEERTKYRERYDRAIVAADGALESGEKIQGVIGTMYSSEIDARIQKDKSEIENPSSEISKLLTSMGIEASQALTTPGVEKILQARAMTQVYLANQDNIIKSHPELKGEIREFEGYRFDLGVQESAPSRSVTRLLTDIPRDTRGQVVDTVTSLTASKPDTIVTRTGDTLRFTDPKNEKYSYEIDLGREPPRLAKSLNGLSISRDIKNTSPEEQAKKDKYETTQKQLQKTSEIYNTATTQFWGIRRDEYTLTGANGENIYSSVFLSENRDTQRRYEELEGRLASDETPRDEKGAIINNMLTLSEEMKSNNLSKLLETGETENHGKIDKMIEGRREQLRILKSTLQDFSEAEKTAKDTPKPQPTSDDTFDEDASVSLNFLVENGLHHLGQEGFEELMNAWNRQHLESKNYQINLQDSPRIGALQKKEFGDFIRKRYGNSEGTRNASLTQEKKNLTNNDFRANNWTDIKNRQDYLFNTTQKADTAKNIPSSDINDSAENMSTQGEVSPTLA